MRKIKQTILILSMFFCAQVCFAKQISFQIVQHDIKTDKVTEDSYIIEDELLNGFFETGYIVTNSPTVISTSDDEDESIYNKAFCEAYDGCSDYFIQVQLYYNGYLSKIDWSISSVSSGKVVIQNSMKDFGKLYKDDDIKKISSKLVDEITKAIKTNKA